MTCNSSSVVNQGEDHIKDGTGLDFTNHKRDAQSRKRWLQLPLNLSMVTNEEILTLIFPYCVHTPDLTQGDIPSAYITYLINKIVDTFQSLEILLERRAFGYITHPSSDRSVYPSEVLAAIT